MSEFDEYFGCKMTYNFDEKFTGITFGAIVGWAITVSVFCIFMGLGSSSFEWGNFGFLGYLISIPVFFLITLPIGVFSAWLPSLFIGIPLWTFAERLFANKFIYAIPIGILIASLILLFHFWLFGWFEFDQITRISMFNPFSAFLVITGSISGYVTIKTADRYRRKRLQT